MHLRYGVDGKKKLNLIFQSYYHSFCPQNRINFPAVVPSSSFHEIRKNGYEDQNRKKVSPRQAIRDGLKELKKEIKNWTEEVKEGCTLDPIMGMPLPGNLCFSSIVFLCLYIKLYDF